MKILRVILFLFFLISFISYFSCSENKKKENKNLQLASGLVLLSAQNDYNCSTSPSPTNFTDFKTAIDSFNTSGYKCSECHGVNTATANFIITNYTSVVERINPGNPKTSVLYFKVKPGGAMSGYSNAKVNQAIYCWILNGANP